MGVWGGGVGVSRMCVRVLDTLSESPGAMSSS